MEMEVRLAAEGVTPQQSLIPTLAPAPEGVCSRHERTRVQCDAVNRPGFGGGLLI